MEPRTGADAWQRVWVELVLLAPRLVSGLAALAGFWLLGRIVAGVLTRVAAAEALDPDLTRLLGRSIRIAALAFGIVTALGTVGLDVKALVTGLGLTGFALGFALRDIIANVLAGILILFYKPFRRGDRISVAGSDGVITEIDLRYTILTVDDTTRVLVPNQTLFTNSIRVERAGQTPRAP
jgi:small conductance mechanosensitive channel